MLRVCNEQQQGEKPVLGGDAGGGVLRQHAELRILPIHGSIRGVRAIYVLLWTVLARGNRPT